MAYPGAVSTGRPRAEKREARSGPQQRSPSAHHDQPNAVRAEASLPAEKRPRVRPVLRAAPISLGVSLANRARSRLTWSFEIAKCLRSHKPLLGECPIGILQRVTSLKRIAIALVVTAVAVLSTTTGAMAASAPSSAASVSVSQGWGAYGPEAVISGHFSIAPDGSVSGTLPPGFTKANPPVDPLNPYTAERIRNSSDTSGLRTFTSGVSASISRVHHVIRARVAGNAGCVNSQSVIGPSGLSYKGNMAGCRVGHLWIHTYLNANGVRVQDGDTNDCYSTTSCSVPYNTYTGAPACRQFVNYSHGINRTTGGDDTAYDVHSPYACW